jgi:hypothetical protein
VRFPGILAAALLLCAPAARAQDVGPPPVEGDAALWAFGVEARMPILRGQPAQFNPDVGVGIGVHIQRSFRSWFALRIAVDHDRTYSRRSVPLGDLGIEVSRSQNLDSTAFLVEPVFRATWRFFTLHAAVGLGAWIAFFNNAEVEPSKKVSARDVLLGLRFEAGTTFRLHRSFSLGLAFNYDLRRSTETVPSFPGGPALRPFDDLMGLSLRFDYLF